MNVVDNMSMYKINSHQHIPEIAQHLKIWNSNFQALQFSTSLIPVSRGIFVSSYAKVAADFDFETIKMLMNRSMRQKLCQNSTTNAPTLRCDWDQFLRYWISL